MPFQKVYGDRVGRYETHPDPPPRKDFVPPVLPAEPSWMKKFVAGAREAAVATAGVLRNAPAWKKLLYTIPFVAYAAERLFPVATERSTSVTRTSAGLAASPAGAFPTEVSTPTPTPAPVLTPAPDFVARPVPAPHPQDAGSAAPPPTGTPSPRSGP